MNGISPHGGPAVSAARVALLALAATALVFAPGFLFPYVVPRAAYLRLAVLAAAAAFLPLLLLRPSRVRDGRDPFLLLLAAWVGWSLVTALAGDAPWRSVFGDLERMEGLVTWGLLLVLYVLLRCLFRDRHWRRFFMAWSIGLGIVSLFALMQLWNPSGLAIPGAGGTYAGRIYGTLGNPGFLAAYFLLSWSILPWVWRRISSRWGRCLLGLAGALSVSVFLAAGSRAAMVGLAAVAAAGAAWMAWKNPRRLAQVVIIVVLATAAALGVAVVGGLDLSRAAGSLASPFTGRSVWPRVLLWEGGLEGIVQHPLLGVGPENFNLVSDRHLPAAMYDRLGSVAVWDRAHNVLVGAAATRGIPGFLLYLGLWSSLLLGVWKARREEALTGVEAAALAGGLLAFGVYLFFWFEDLTSLVLWIMLAAFLRHTVEDGLLLEIGTEAVEGQGRRVMAAGAVVVLALTGWALAVRPLLAARDAGQAGAMEARAERVLSGGEDGNAGSLDADRQVGILEAYQAALQHSEVLGWEILVRQVNRLAVLSLRPDRVRARQELAEAVGSGVRTAADRTEAELRRDPENGRVHLKHGQLLRVAHALSPPPEALDRAVDAARRGVELAPARLDHRLVLAATLLEAGRSDEALSVLEEVRARAPGWGRADVHRARVLAARGEHGRALEALRSAFRSGHSPATPGPTLTVGGWLREEGRFREEAALYASHLATVRSGTYGRWARTKSASGVEGADDRGREDRPRGTAAGSRRDGPRAGPAPARARSLAEARSERLPPHHLPVLGRLPPALLRAGDREGAVASARILLEEILARPGPSIRASVIRPALRFAEEVERGEVEAWRDRTSLLPGSETGSAADGPSSVPAVPGAGEGLPGATASPSGAPGRSPL